MKKNAGMAIRVPRRDLRYVALDVESHKVVASGKSLAAVTRRVQSLRKDKEINTIIAFLPDPNVRYIF